MEQAVNWRSEILGAVILTVLALGWIDWLWVFGVEASKSYTWWALIYHLGN